MRKLRPITRVTVEKVSWKDGESNGRAWRKIGILTKEYGDKWLGSFENKMNQKFLGGISEGSSIDIVVSESGDFLNFSQATYLDEVAAAVIELQNHNFGAASGDPQNQESEVDPDDLPF